eukprot:gene17624-12616_t
MGISPPGHSDRVTILLDLGVQNNTDPFALPVGSNAIAASVRGAIELMGSAK